MINANLLMINDLIYCGTNNPYRIVHIGHLEEVKNYPEKYSPIPITTELLIKNGFVKTDDHIYSFLLRDNRTINFTMENENMMMTLSNNNADIATSFSIPINNVHTFQHFLTLANIDKDIEL